jgi:hypothetical protein
VNLDTVPDITMRGQADPYGITSESRPPTVGQLAARIHDLAGRPGDWWHLAVFDRTAPVRTPLEETGGIRLWLTTWPPHHRTDVHDHGEGAGVTVLVAGELVEVAINDGGVSERAFRTNRARVHGGGQPHELRNPGRAYAVTICAHLT